MADFRFSPIDQQILVPTQIHGRSPLVPALGIAAIPVQHRADQPEDHEPLSLASHIRDYKLSIASSRPAERARQPWFAEAR